VATIAGTGIAVISCLQSTPQTAFLQAIPAASRHRRRDEEALHPADHHGRDRVCLADAGNHLRGWPRLQHANLSWGFGPLGAILVSPQYHRIHHSRDREHHDCNYGDLLTIWDRAFGTMYHKPGVYPPTGLDGVRWSAPADNTPRGAVLRTLEQLWYPVKSIAQGGWRSRG
jgi:hypothetical protein